MKTLTIGLGLSKVESTAWCDRYCTEYRVAYVGFSVDLKCLCGMTGHLDHLDNHQDMNKY